MTSIQPITISTPYNSFLEMIVEKYSGKKFTLNDLICDENVSKSVSSIQDGVTSPKNKGVKKYNIEKDSINIFYQSNIRSKNDTSNKLREEIVCKLGNNEISEEWIKNDWRWNSINSGLNEKIHELSPNNYTYYKFIPKGGRKFNYDFEIHFYNSSELCKLCKMEFKYGADEVSDCPQWCSPHNPSQYFNISYEELFYDEYLPQLCHHYKLPIPERGTYFKEIHNDKPQCMTLIQGKYYKGAPKSRQYTGLQEDINNYKFAKKLNNKSIKEFLEKAIFKTEEMNKYLKNSQEGKIYLLWNNGKFNLRKRSLEQYQINQNSIKIKNDNSVCGKTLSGCDIKMLLRWKNGVSYPALQIS